VILLVVFVVVAAEIVYLVLVSSLVWLILAHACFYCIVAVDHGLAGVFSYVAVAQVVATVLPTSVCGGS
jgi:hypothetical protein